MTLVKELHISEPQFSHHFFQISSYGKRKTKSDSEITDMNAIKIQRVWVYVQTRMCVYICECDSFLGRVVNVCAHESELMCASSLALLIH